MGNRYDIGAKEDDKERNNKGQKRVVTVVTDVVVTVVTVRRHVGSSQTILI